MIVVVTACGGGGGGGGGGGTLKFKVYSCEREPVMIIIILINLVGIILPECSRELSKIESNIFYDQKSEGWTRCIRQFFS